MYGGRVVSITTQERAYCTIQENDRLEIIAGEKRATIQHDEDLRLTGDRLDILRATLLESLTPAPISGEALGDPGHYSLTK